MSQINLNSTQSIDGGSLLNNVGRSPQLAFALLQMELAKSNKEEALKGIKEIQDTQAEKRSYADAINAARDLQQDGNVRGSATQAEYDSAINTAKDYRDRKWAAVGGHKEFCENHGITPAPYGDLNKAVQIWDKAIDQLDKLKTVNAACDKANISMPNSSDKDTNKAQWDKVIASLQTKMDTIGADIQTKMVQLQDMMGQYNSYMQGANSAISTSNQTLSSLARGQ